MPVHMVVQSEVKFLATWLLRSWVQIPFQAWMFVPCLYMFYCFMQRPCNNLITYPRSPAMCVSEMNVWWRRGLALTVI